MNETYITIYDDNEYLKDKEVLGISNDDFNVSVDQEEVQAINYHTTTKNNILFMVDKNSGVVTYGVDNWRVMYR